VVPSLNGSQRRYQHEIFLRARKGAGANLQVLKSTLQTVEAACYLKVPMRRIRPIGLGTRRLSHTASGLQLPTERWQELELTETITLPPSWQSPRRCSTRKMNALLPNSYKAFNPPSPRSSAPPIHRIPRDAIRANTNTILHRRHRHTADMARNTRLRTATTTP
jgi:hypothetical protein